MLCTLGCRVAGGIENCAELYLGLGLGPLRRQERAHGRWGRLQRGHGAVYGKRMDRWYIVVDTIFLPASVRTLGEYTNADACGAVVERSRIEASRRRITLVGLRPTSMILTPSGSTVL